MLEYGCTRLEIGVQSVYEDVARDTNRCLFVARDTNRCSFVAFNTSLSLVQSLGGHSIYWYTGLGRDESLTEGKLGRGSQHCPHWEMTVL